jgi:hypothetical protein
VWQGRGVLADNVEAHKWCEFRRDGLVGYGIVLTVVSE